MEEAILRASRRLMHCRLIGSESCVVEGASGIQELAFSEISDINSLTFLDAHFRSCLRSFYTFRTTAIMRMLYDVRRRGEYFS